MRILAVDVGTGTQDILLFDSEQLIENAVQLVLPSPTIIAANRIKAATASRKTIVLTGVTMGGGPSSWAAEAHLRSHLALFATPAAAKTFDDDLAAVEAMGIRIVSEDEAAVMQDATRIRLGDFDPAAIEAVLARFDVPPADAYAVAAFDHGNAPVGYSDRLYRFEFLEKRIDLGLGSFAFRGGEIPEDMTRLSAVASDAGTERPVLVMDTGPAAVLGALDDLAVRESLPGIVANIGNFHTLAFALDGSRIVGMFEHHTGELSRDSLETFLEKLANGSLTNAEVFHSKGHGAIVRGILAGGDRSALTPLAVTGPRRGLLDGSQLQPYLAVPHGDMMLAGCFGLLRAWASKDAAVAEQVNRQLGQPFE